MITLRELTLEDGAALAEMLNDDVVLRADLGIRGEYKNTADSVMRDVGEWCRPRRAVSFAILADGVTVGMISLSRIDPMTGTGRIGYWVGSRYRRQGYCAKAFKLVLQEALRRDVHKVSSSIDNANTASRRLWEDAGASSTPLSADRAAYTLGVETRTY